MIPILALVGAQDGTGVGLPIAVLLALGLGVLGRVVRRWWLPAVPLAGLLALFAAWERTDFYSRHDEFAVWFPLTIGLGLSFVTAFVGVALGRYRHREF